MTEITCAAGVEGEIIPNRRELEQNWTEYRKGAGTTFETIRNWAITIGLALIVAVVTMVALSISTPFLAPLAIAGSGLLSVGLCMAALHWSKVRYFERNRSYDQRAQIATDVTEY